MSRAGIYVSPAPTIPNPPSGLEITSTQTGTIELAWVDNSPNETGFSLERCEGVACTNFAEIVQTGPMVTSYIDSGLNFSTTKRYRVRALNAIGYSAYSNIVESVTQVSPISLSDYGTLQDEKDVYDALGWSWNSGQLPTIPTGIRTITTIDVHNSLEADDLWQNIIMYQRTGGAGYLDLATSWASYYKDYYASNWASDLASFFGDHTFGWGLIDWAILASNTAYRTAAEAIGDTLETAWYDDFSTSTKNGFNGLRGPGRILKLAVKLGRRTWADDIWTALRDSIQWDESRVINGTTVGFWKELDAGTVTDVFPFATGATGFLSSFEFAVLNEGLSDYYELTGAFEVQRRLILMARFAQELGLDGSSQHTGHFLLVDFGGVDNFFHTGVGASGTQPGELLDPFYTCTMVNVLTRGYILTGDTDLLALAVVHWERASKAVAGDTYPYTNRTASNLVGHFMNAQPLIGNIFYTSDGELPYVGLLFKAYLNGPPPPPPPPTTINATPTTVQSGSAVTVSWSDIDSPTSLDWIGLYSPTQGDVGSIKWVYVSGTQTPTTAMASGSISFTIPSGLATGTYEFRLFHGSSYIRMTTSQLITVNGSALSLTASPASQQQGNAFTLTWSGIPNPSIFDWVGLYTLTGADSPSIGYIYINSGTQTPGVSAAASGSQDFPVCTSPCANRDGMPDDLATGDYEFRLFSNGTYTRLATSNSITVTAATPTVPADPSSLVATALTSTQISLAWTDNSRNEDSFSIERAIGAGSFSVLATTAANATSYSDTGLTPSTLHRYKIRAHNTVGFSGYTSIASATTPAAGSTQDLWTVLPNSSLRTLLQATSYIVSPGPDGVSYPMDNIILSWSGGVIFERPNGEQWLIIKNGGHDSWFYNDVWGYRINGASPGWQNLRSSYLPYITYQDWDGHLDPITGQWDGTPRALGKDPYNLGAATGYTAAYTVYPDGSPGNAHTYDRCFYSPLTDEVVYPTGAHTSGGPRQCPINHFSMVTHQWSYGPSWFDMGLTHHIATSDVRSDGKLVVDSGIMVLYDPVTKTVSSLSTTTSENVFYQTGRYVNGRMYNLGPFSNADPRYSEGSFVHVHEVGVSGDTVMTVTGGPIVGGAAPGFVWEPALNAFVIWGGGAEVQILTLTSATTGTLTTRVVPGSNPGDALHYSGQFSLGIYKRFGRISQGVYILMNSLDEVHKLTLEI